MSQTRLGRLCLLTCAAVLAGWIPATAETLTLVWDPNAEPQVAGYIVYVGPSPGSYTQRIDVGLVTQYGLDAIPDATYCFAVSAYVAGPEEGPQSTEICASTQSSNTAPTLANPGDQSSPVGQPLSLSLSAIDPEGAPLTYTVSGLPAGLTVSGTGIISGTPTQTGAPTVTATVSDGDLSATVTFGWTVTGGAAGAATLLRPTGAIATTAPVFEWTPVATATRYRLWVDDAGPNQQLQRDLTPSEAGCATITGGAVCRSSLGLTLTAGPASWSVRATNAYGDGPWAGAMDFTMPGNQGPTVTIVTPTTAATYSTGTATIAISGTAADDGGVTAVSWATDRGASGSAVGTSAWTVPSIPLQPGANVVTVTARDGSNNTATDVLTVTFADTQVPTVVIAQPTTAATYSTAALSLALSGTAADNVGVSEVRWSNSQGGSGLATGTASWSTGAIVLKQGMNAIFITAHDAAGNVAADVLTVTVSDGQAPTVLISMPTAATTYTTSSPTLALGGTTSDDVGVTEVRWSNSQGGSGIATGASTWSAGTIALKVGTNVITVTARDAAGNTATDSLTVTVTDNVAPTVSITRPGTTASSLSTPSSAIVLTGTAADAFGVAQVAWSNSRGGSGVAAGTTSWTVSGIPIQAGANIITITARDSAGLVGSDTITVTRTDGEAPTVSLATPTTGGTYATTSRTLALSGTSADAVGVSQVTWANNRGGGGTAAGTTNWVVQGVALQMGTNLVTVTAHDTAGNAGQAVLSVTVTDGEPPTVAIVSPVAAATFSTTVPSVAITGTAADAGGVTAVTWSNSQGGGGTAIGTTSWSVPAVTLVPGVNVITVLARDTGGNTGRTQLTITTIDTRLPVVVIGTYRVSPSGAGMLEIVGTASDDFGLAAISWRSSRGGSGVAIGTTGWTATVPIQQGSNDITVVATDKAGNSAIATLKINGSKIGKNTTPVTPTNATPTTSGAVTSPTMQTSNLVPTPAAPPRPATTPVLPPQLAILAPDGNGPWVTAASTVPLKGTATDNVTRVTWTVDWGGSGTASGTRAWTIPTIGLQIGKNVITVTAMTADGRIARQSVTVTYRPLRTSR